MKSQQSPENKSIPRLIAFYLTQFHPIPENDQWWGKGFTEWTNVTKAAPLFEGHYQPHLPTDFGFYDLRVRDTRRDQIKTAKRYGIDGFCYHYYWFSGKRILNLPLDDMLADHESDMPFCLCWANENWTRRWDGAEHELLVSQDYLPEDDINFIKSLEPFFKDQRYIKVDGKPYLIVYRPQNIPDVHNTLKVWRDYCRLVGLGEIHLCAALTHGNEKYAHLGFDSGVEFPPHNFKPVNVSDKIKFTDEFNGQLMQYATIAQSFIDHVYDDERVFKTVFPSWDNTARTKDRAVIVLNGTPENYEYWLSSTIDLAQQFKKEESLVFINAWNEWAEGCHLEPDRLYGYGFLQATLNAKSGLRKFSVFQHIELPKVELPKVELSIREEGLQLTFWEDIKKITKHHFQLKFTRLKVAVGRHPWLYDLLLPIVKGVRSYRTRKKNVGTQKSK